MEIDLFTVQVYFFLLQGLLYLLKIILLLKSIGYRNGYYLFHLYFQVAVYAFYFFNKRAISVLIIYLFLIGSIIYVNSVDYAFNNFLKPHQKERVDILLGFKIRSHGTGYNVNQSIISIGSGGFSGKGFLQGTQTKFKFVPKQSSDFIFCTVGEEWGFLGSAVVIGIYLFLLLRLIILAERQRSVLFKDLWLLCCFNTFYSLLSEYRYGYRPCTGDWNPITFFKLWRQLLMGIYYSFVYISCRLDASRTEYLV